MAVARDVHARRHGGNALNFAPSGLASNIYYFFGQTFHILSCTIIRKQNFKISTLLTGHFL